MLRLFLRIFIAFFLSLTVAGFVASAHFGLTNLASALHLDSTATLLHHAGPFWGVFIALIWIYLFALALREDLSNPSVSKSLGDSRFAEKSWVILAPVFALFAFLVAVTVVGRLLAFALEEEIALAVSAAGLATAIGISVKNSSGKLVSSRPQKRNHP